MGQSGPLMKPTLRLQLLMNVALGLVTICASFVQPGLVHAAAEAPSGPDRYTTIRVDITLHEWWLIAWKDNNVYCSFYADHEGLPNSNDILSACGEQLFAEWQAYSAPCSQQEISACPGYYLLEISSKASQKEITVKLPPPQVWVSLENCNPDPDGWCATQPTLVLTGEEPLPDEVITSLQGFAGDDAFSCTGSRCTFNLEQTDSEGIELQFWANSSHGDTSQSFSASVRVLTQGGGENDAQLVQRWYVDVLSPQWTGSQIASCALSWDAFPPAEGLPQWLTTPDSPEELVSSVSYAYLAGNLISQGQVDVSACLDGGLDESGAASACGLTAAETTVRDWQNQFDKLILDTSQTTNVPAQLLKNLFSRESQFWPGAARPGTDSGLGQLTENGADTALLWNHTFYLEFCPLVLDRDVCVATPYSNLSAGQQSLLRGALVASVDASCQNCPLGLDLSRANFSVAVFGRAMLANCEQTGKIVQNLTGKVPGQALSYEDLWRLTLVNYNAGAGCLSDALEIAQDQATDAAPLGWESISGALAPACQGAINYVDDISQPPASP